MLQIPRVLERTNECDQGVRSLHHLNVLFTSAPVLRKIALRIKRCANLPLRIAEISPISRAIAYSAERLFITQSFRDGSSFRRGNGIGGGAWIGFRSVSSCRPRSLNERRT